MELRKTLTPQNSVKVTEPQFLGFQHFVELLMGSGPQTIKRCDQLPNRLMGADFTCILHEMRQHAMWVVQRGWTSRFVQQSIRLLRSTLTSARAVAGLTSCKKGALNAGLNF